MGSCNWALDLFLIRHFFTEKYFTMFLSSIVLLTFANPIFLSMSVEIGVVIVKIQIFFGNNFFRKQLFSAANKKVFLKSEVRNFTFIFIVLLRICENCLSTSREKLFKLFYILLKGFIIYFFSISIKKYRSYTNLPRLLLNTY